MSISIKYDTEMFIMPDICSRNKNAWQGCALFKADFDIMPQYLQYDKNEYDTKMLAAENQNQPRKWYWNIW